MPQYLERLGTLQNYKPWGGDAVFGWPGRATDVILNVIEMEYTETSCFHQHCDPHTDNRFLLTRYVVTQKCL